MALARLLARLRFVEVKDSFLLNSVLQHPGQSPPESRRGCLTTHYETGSEDLLPTLWCLAPVTNL